MTKYDDEDHEEEEDETWLQRGETWLSPRLARRKLTAYVDDLFL